MVPHNRCTNGDLLSDGNFQLEVYIELDCEEVLPHHDVEDEVISKMKSHVDEKFETMESKFATMEVKVQCCTLHWNKSKRGRLPFSNHRM